MIKEKTLKGHLKLNQVYGYKSEKTKYEDFEQIYLYPGENLKQQKMEPKNGMITLAIINKPNI